MKSSSSDSCGCAMGATFMAAGLLVQSVYGGWQLHASQLSWPGFILRLLFAAFVSGAAGKIVGMLRSRMAHSPAWKER